MVGFARRTSVLVALVLLPSIVAGLASADPLSIDAIRQALLPPPTRSLSSHEPPGAQADEQFIDTLRNRPGASLTSDDRTRLAAVKGNKPSVDLEVRFGFNSDVLRGQAVRTVEMLGAAITGPEFKDRTFLLAGYTDAKGNDQFNQQLSERRAEAVKRYLVGHFHVDAANLIAVGYGRTDLKNPGSPLAAENRRVQAVNILPFRSARR